MRGIGIGTRTEELKDAEGKIEASPRASYPPGQVVIALLTDIRSDLQSIRGMMIYFVVMSVLGVIVGILYAIGQTH